MENEIKDSNTNEEACGKVLMIKSNQSFNESNLMTLPWISLKRKKVDKIVRTWNRGDKEVGLIVKGSVDYGCPTIYELDVLLGLNRIQSNNMNNIIEVSSDNKVTNLSQVINFTYRGLAKAMGLKGFGKKTKERLENSIKCLVETTVYSDLSLRDQEIGEYIVDFKGEESCRILKNYKAYSIEKRKKVSQKLLSAKEIEEFQSVEIDDFFFSNLCNNYFKLFDHDKYLLCTKSISKKILLILSQWSHGYEKYLTYKTLYDYIGLEITSKQDEYYYSKQIKEALEELVSINFIQAFEINKEGINFIFNTTVKTRLLGSEKYKTDFEVVARLREIGIEYKDINKYCGLDTINYISALLRYVDFRIANKTVANVKDFTYAGLPYKRYDVSKFEIEI